MLFTSLSLDSAENRIINFCVGEEAQKDQGFARDTCSGVH